MSKKTLSHVGRRGQARMVDVTAKPETDRRAVAEGVVTIAPTTMRLVKRNAAKKGDVIGTARLAGIGGAKRTAELIPLCHPLRIDSIDVEIRPVGATRLSIRAEVRARDRTGVEMEALTAVVIAALTIYDMVKAVDRGAEIGKIRLLEKSGGASGTWRRTRR